MWPLWTLLLVLLAPGSAPAADGGLPEWTQELEPEAAIVGQPAAIDIDARMRAVYAGAKSYLDSGTIRNLPGGWPGPGVVRTFTTTFSRQGFKFEIQSEGPSPKRDEVVWNEDDPPPPPQLFEKTPVPAVTQAVEKATQLLGLPGAFHHLMLLLPQTADLGMPRLAKRSDGQILSRVADGAQDGRPCYRLQLLDRTRFQFRRIFWIEKSTFHLLRVDEKGHADLVDGPDLDIDRQIVYRPVFGARARAASPAR